MHNPLLTVARFEIKTLLRSWFFRIFSAIVVAFVLFFNIMASTDIGRAGWPDRMLIGGLPYMNLWVLNIVQAVIAVFLSADFLSRDKKLDTTEVIYVRNMSNLQYVFGKTLGILTVFSGLNLLVLLFTLIINFISPDAGFSAITYVLYPLIISFPTLLFILGISFFVMLLVKNQAITFILVLGFIATSIFYLKGKHFGIWDFITFNTPLAYSSYVNFSDTFQLLAIRGGYLLLGLGLIFLTVYKLPRLSQGSLSKKILLVPALVSILLGTGMIGLYVFQKANNEKQIQDLVKIEKELPISAGYSINHYDIQIKHSGSNVEGEMIYKVQSEEKNLPSELRFFFNSGLKVKSVTISDNPVQFNHELNILSMKGIPDKSASVEIHITFKGKPVNDLAYFDLKQEVRESDHRLDPLLAGKKVCFLTSNYLLFTKESLWYPIVAERNAFRTQRFFTYSLKINSENDLNYIAQGNKTLKDGWTIFEGDVPYAKISLAGGKYQTKSIMVDSVEYCINAKADNYFFAKYFENINDTLPFLIRTLKGDFERKLGVKYPYKRLQFVEVPVHFYSHYRSWSLCNENTHPEMIFVPEFGAGIRSFNLANRNSNRGGPGRGRDNDSEELLPKEKESNLFMDLVGNVFAQPERGRRFFRGNDDLGRTLSDWSAYSVFPLFYNYAYGLEEKDLPFFNMCLEWHMLNRIQSTNSRFGRLSSTDKSILFLNKNSGSIKELADRDDLDVSIADIIVTTGSNMFATAQSRIGSDKFDSYIDSLLAANVLSTIEDKAIIKLIEGKERSELSLNTDVDLKLPAYTFGEYKIYEFKDDNRERYYISIEVANNGEADGIIKASVMGGRGGRGGGRGPGGGRMSTAHEENYLINQGEQVKIGIIVDDAPRMLSVHTYLSKNIPSDTRFSLADFTKAPKGFKAETGIIYLDKEIKFISDNEVVVDNEDEGFSVVNTSGRKTLKEMISINRDEESEDNGSEYKSLRFFRPDARWTPVLDAMAFGDYTKSFMYKKSGDGAAKARFAAQLQATGRYNVYARIPSSRMGNFRNQDPQDASYTFMVHHDDGDDEVVVPIESESPEWFLLGEFYFSDGEAVVELSDKTTKSVVIADAVKWVKL